MKTLSILKWSGWIAAAIVVLTVLVTGAAIIAGLSILAGLLLSLVSTVIFTASALRTYFDSSKDDKN